MDDMDTFDRQLASVVLRRVGPSVPVDDAAIFTAITATRSPKWRFQPMFSATRFVVAGAIVALFGGFLLAGVLTQPSEETAPVVGASASPTARATIELETEQVRPGVFRVLAAADGRPLPVVDEIAVDEDGVVWVNTAEGFAGINLAGLAPGWETPDASGAPLTTDHNSDLHLAADGTLLAHDTERVMWYPLADESPGWIGMEPPQPWDEPRAVHRASDGSLWVSGWRSMRRTASNRSLGESTSGIARYLGDWELSLTDIEASDFAETPDGALWAASGAGLHRFVGGEWRSEQPFDDGVAFNASHLAVGPSGELWAYLMRHDEPREFLGRLDDDGWTLFEKPSTADGGFTENRRIAVADDGTVWLASGDWALHDGRWVRPFPEAETYPAMGPAASGDVDIGPDGKVWVVDGPGALFYLTPEALAEANEASVPSSDVDSATPDILPGVDLVTEEVDPGVYRVLSDGVRDLGGNAWDVSVSADGDVWIEWREAQWVYKGRPDDLPPFPDGQFVRLGEAEVVPSSGRTRLRRAIDPDGTPREDESGTDSGADAGSGSHGWHDPERPVDVTGLGQLGFVASSPWTDLRHVLVASVAPDGHIWTVVTRHNVKLCQFEWEACDIVSDGLYVVTPEAVAAAEPATEAKAMEATTPALVPGVDLVTEEVEPGVYRVLHDGVRDLEWDTTEGLGEVAVISTDGEVWLALGESARPLGDDQEYAVEWVTFEPDSVERTGSTSARLVPGERGEVTWTRGDGRTLYRYSPAGREVFTAADDTPVFTGMAYLKQWTVVAPDGAGWFSRFDDFGNNPVVSSDCGGLVRYDGERSTYFFQDRGFCVGGIDVDARGNVWVLGWSHGDAALPDGGVSSFSGPAGIYVITPEALGAEGLGEIEPTIPPPAEAG